MINNIVLAGGTTMMTGFTQRIAIDLFNENFVYHPPNIVAENYRYNSTSGSVLQCLVRSTFKKYSMKLVRADSNTCKKCFN
jgi:hypothetical protein